MARGGTVAFLPIHRPRPARILDNVPPVTTVSKWRPPSGSGRILLIFVAFISLGLPDGLLGVAWPSIRDGFARPLDSLGTLLLAFTTGYLTSSFLSGWAITRAGVGRLLAASCAITGLSLLGYTMAGHWWIVVALAVVTGLGAGAIDGGINTYVAAHYGERLMHWLHASWGIGITLGPLIMTAGLQRFHTWRWGYLLVGSAQLVLGVYFAATAGRWTHDRDRPERDEDRRLTDFRTPYAETLLQPKVWLSALLFFLFAGTEATAGMWIYTLLTESRGFPTQWAGILTGGYWATFTLGRIVAGAFARRIGGKPLIRLCLLGALTGSVLLRWNPTQAVSLLGIVLLGFSIAPIFPELVSATSDRVGRRHAATAIGMQIGAAGLGAAVLPGIAGILAQHISMETIPLFLVALIALLIFLNAVIASLRRF